MPFGRVNIFMVFFSQSEGIFYNFFVAVDLDARVRDPSSVAYTRGGKLNALLGRMIVSG